MVRNFISLCITFGLSLLPAVVLGTLSVPNGAMRCIQKSQNVKVLHNFQSHPRGRVGRASFGGNGYRIAWLAWFYRQLYGSQRIQKPAKTGSGTFLPTKSYYLAGFEP